MNRPDRWNTLILVVDSEEDTRSALYELLAGEGYRVETCADAFEALRAVAREKPALVITDVLLPGIDGLELLAKVRYASPSTHAILHTAPMDMLERDGCDVVPKGSSDEEILSAVRDCLQAARA